MYTDRFLDQRNTFTLRIRSSFRVGRSHAECCLDAEYQVCHNMSQCRFHVRSLPWRPTSVNIQNNKTLKIHDFRVLRGVRGAQGGARGGVNFKFDKFNSKRSVSWRETSPTSKGGITKVF